MKNMAKGRVIAYYLPQYHPIAENDEWWGKGFTEWTNVGKAKPLFKGHYQPRVPADLGYYDLRLDEVREAQAEMAQLHGIEGFMYWHYWFGNGKRILEMPFERLVNIGKPNFPFCLGWANHSWSNHEWNPEAQWKRKKHLIEQTYPGINDIVEHFNVLQQAFHDKRYIKINNKPVFLIYSPLTVPNIKEHIDTWQNLAIKSGLDGIYFIGLCHTHVPINQVLEMGFDAINTNGQWMAESKIKGKKSRSLQYNINKILGGVKIDKYKYQDIIKNIFEEVDKLENVYPTILPQWDRSPRSGRRAVIYTDSNPELFKSHVEDALSLIENKSDQNKIIFLKSWNEWAEGNYMEPDLKYGNEYLKSLNEALEEAYKKSSKQNASGLL
jgi:hypothetical protein